MREKERMHTERGAEGQKEREGEADSPLSREPNLGLDPWGSRPEPPAV